jgi:hypothetical protein
LWDYSAKESIRPGDSSLYLSPFTAKFLLTVHTLAKRAGLQDNTPIIDLSGLNPGIIYALGGYTPKTPWIYSNYPGSQLYAYIAFNKFTCEQIADSWIIVDINRRLIPIDSELLKSFGINPSTDYQRVGMVIKNDNFYKYNFNSSYTEFYKPKRTKDEGVAACLSSKTFAGLM